jgi:hypothetical protein
MMPAATLRSVPQAGEGADPRPARAAGAGVLALALLGAGAVALWSRAPRARMPSRDPAWRALHAAAAGLCASVLLDSAVEHYRGAFENPGMLAPLAASTLGLLAGIDAARDSRWAPGARTGAYALAMAVGTAGTGFHVYNVLRQPGGVSWLNLFYAAPLGAPAALGLAGAIGLAAQRTLAPQPGQPVARIAGLPAGRALCALVAAGLAGTVGEVSLLHFRGSFQNPFMWLPVSLPPVAAALTAKAAFERRAPPRRLLTRAWLWLTTMLGIAGVGFHAYGVSRAMGGWSNWRQNLVDGPPLPAPPSFSALAIAALAALRVRDREHA